MERFVGGRLELARKLRRVSAVELARSAGVSPEWVSALENQDKEPTEATAAALARELDLPTSFLYRPIRSEPRQDGFHFRASSRLAKRDERAAVATSLLAAEVSEWIDAHYSLPECRVPEVQDLIDADTALSPETAADVLRGHWGLGVTPVGSMLRLLESRGVRVFSLGGPVNALDAFSFRHDGVPIVFLNTHKTAERLRYDLAHELGHLVMHAGSLDVEDGRVKERQANEFASAFLMPRDGLIGTFRRALEVDEVMRVKSIWRVSAMALVVRAHGLGQLSEWQYRSLAQRLSSAGFRKSEPGSSLTAETSLLLSQIMEDMRSNGETIADIARDICVQPHDIRGLFLGLVTIALPGQSSSSTGARPDLRLVHSAHDAG